MSTNQCEKLTVETPKEREIRVLQYKVQRTAAYAATNPTVSTVGWYSISQIHMCATESNPDPALGHTQTQQTDCFTLTCTCKHEVNYVSACYSEPVATWYSSSSKLCQYSIQGQSAFLYVFFYGRCYIMQGW